MFSHAAWSVGSYSSGPPAASTVGSKQGLHLIAILPDHEFRFSRANDHDLIRLE